MNSLTARKPLGCSERGPRGLPVRLQRREGAPLLPRNCTCARQVEALAVSERSSGDGGAPEDYQRIAASLNQLLARPTIDGRQLRELVVQKWGRSYDVRLTRLQGRMYLQVMWKFLEQQSFPLTEEEYLQQLDAVAEYLTEWNVIDTVRLGITRAPKPPGYTGGGNARCVSIPLDVDLGGTRSAEWN